MKGKTLRKSGLCMAMGICLASMVMPALAANTDGSLAGRVAAGAEVTVRSADTGFTRTVKADANGNYRFPFLPIGTYQLQASKDGAAIGSPINVVVSLGNEANVNLGAGGATDLAAVQVIGSRVITPVDVRSTESATNVTKAELERVPVGRDAQSVALLAPGVIQGQYGGASFGGSSVSENAVYVNGLNVTDFYKRVGFSSVPFGFFKEFQVKTGGYSVEFGRTTGGVINAVTQSGTNEFKYGAELVWEPSSLQSDGKNHYDRNGDPFRISSKDKYDRTNLNVYASGPIVKDKLFFYAMYEFRDYRPENTNDKGSTFFKGKSDKGFWGTKLDWQINDQHLLEFLAFSDKNDTTTDNYDYDLDSGRRGDRTNTQYSEAGGTNWALTYTGYLTENFSMKALYGENKRDRIASSLNDIACDAVQDRRLTSLPQIGCVSSAQIEKGLDKREAARLDFEWQLGNHLLRFGLDREVNTSDNESFYPGPSRKYYQIYPTRPGTTIENGGVVPAGVTAYVRARQQEVSGTFESINSAYYIEDNWQITPDFMLNAGVRVEGFNNKNGEGNTYIKIDDMVAPRLGFSWDFKGDGRAKIFGNIGRYFLPIVNQINVKQAGAFLDERTYYVFNGLEPFVYNGQTYMRPILGAQIGPVDNSQGDGTVGDLRSEVDADIDPVFQDEAILGYQSMIDETWSWGVRGIYRRLHNAIDDMNITSNGILCGGTPGEIGYVMANPGKSVKLYTDTNCDGVNDAYVNIDTSRAGWAMYDADGNYVGEHGWVKPKRTYRALEFMVDRAWDDKWAFNASYTWSKSEGNAEGPSNSDFGFDNTGRTESFDKPWVNWNGDGPLPNDRRHQIKLRGAYAFNDNWSAGVTLNAQSGRPINAFGKGNPFDGDVYHSFYVCVANCQAENFAERTYELRRRGSGGRTPWIFDVGASVSYQRSFGPAALRVKLAVYNLLNQQRKIEVDDEFESDVGFPNEAYRLGTGYQTPRYAQLTVSVDF
ncbi:MULTISPECIES: TonB-dependent receptor [Lysobacter]|uniref:TonB-dependent receptor n=1 Tax=Lysobacter TaxID=68 RepID=UPI001F4422F3|nr:MULTISPECIES: TonB-dependent receptor [Lysobacter]UJB19826.1 TonB-dependent receptor [Lysobacter capsici]UJQ26448.1 TonB-dependent receptor [Lysobacter gummosus]